MPKDVNTKPQTRFEEAEAAALSETLAELQIARNTFIRWAVMCGCGRGDLADQIESTYSVDGLEEAMGQLVVTRFKPAEAAVLTETVERTGMSNNTTIRLMVMLACGRRDLADKLIRQHAEIAEIIARGPATRAAVRATRSAMKKVVGG